ncbi:hypothetical protein [Brevundimonas sanguinis]|uniref:hypothetical protein n=1 Tax=Brevundimonas sanguinis TaxID=3021811 RepID=UPI0024154C98|nr:hypothetical protein [Brevundimonas sp. NCCP 15609]
MKKIAILSLAFLAGCGSALDIRDAKEAVKDTLRDPGSAEFRHVRVVRQDGQPRVVCGAFNGKNAFGGYVGFRDFYYRDGYLRVGSEVGDASRSLAEIEDSTRFIREHARLCLGLDVQP